jgi:hypothetical protein
MRQIPGRTLWLGHAGDLRRPDAVLSAGIEAVVELADSEQLALLPRELVRCRFPLSGGGDNPSWLLRMACESVAALLRAGVPTLVCCANGLSRSICVAAGATALSDRQSFEQALSLVTKDGPADVSPLLASQIQGALRSEM